MTTEEKLDLLIKTTEEQSRTLDLFKQHFNKIYTEQSRMSTALEALAAGLKDTQKELADFKKIAATKDYVKEVKTELKTEIKKVVEEAKVELKTDLTIEIQNLRADITKKLKSHDKRLTTIEDDLDLPHPEKN